MTVPGAGMPGTGRQEVPCPTAHPAPGPTCPPSGAGWASVDTGALPSLDDARADVQEELEVLCRVLGPLAAVDPDDVFPRDPWWE